MTSVESLTFSSTWFLTAPRTSPMPANSFHKCRGLVSPLAPTQMPTPHLMKPSTCSTYPTTNPTHSSSALMLCATLVTEPFYSNPRSTKSAGSSSRKKPHATPCRCASWKSNSMPCCLTPYWRNASPSALRKSSSPPPAPPSPTFTEIIITLAE